MGMLRAGGTGRMLGLRSFFEALFKYFGWTEQSPAHLWASICFLEALK